MKIDPGNLTQAQLGALFGVSRKTIHAWQNAGLPFEELGPKRLRFNLTDVIKWRREQALKKKATANPQSELVEARKGYEAKLLELKVARLEREDALAAGEFLRRAEVKKTMHALAAVIRGAVETLARSHGQDAAEIVGDALSDFMEMIQREYGPADNQNGRRRPRVKQVPKGPGATRRAKTSRKRGG